jgi:hypothetical protein
MEMRVRGVYTELQSKIGRKFFLSYLIIRSESFKIMDDAICTQETEV